MNTVRPNFLSVIRLLACTNFGFAQERSVFAVRLPDGRLQLVTDGSADAAQTKVAIETLRSAFKCKTLWFRRNGYEPLKCTDVLADNVEESSKAQSSQQQTGRKADGTYSFDDFDARNVPTF
jgi:hypothetical protein